jgi:hypothetical protein
MLSSICYPHNQYSNIGERNGLYKEDGWKGMLRMNLEQNARRLGIQGRNFGRVLLPLFPIVKMTPLRPF